MAKASKTEKPTPEQLAEKVSIDADFHDAMKLLAHHANTKGTPKHTYKSRNNDKA